MKHTTVHAITLLSLLISGTPARASMACYVDPVSEYHGNGTITSSVFMRDGACTEGTSILSTLNTKQTVDVIGFTDGWWRVEVNGVRGWVGQQFVQTSAVPYGRVWTSYTQYMIENATPDAPIADAPVPTLYLGETPQTDPALIRRVSGYILLQTQSHGEAWYIDPVTASRYYMKDGPSAYQIMRSFGLGVTEADYTKINSGNWSIKNRLRGRIILRVQMHGEAYYIHPKDLSVHYLKDGAEAYQVMRHLSLGITNADLEKIPAEAVRLR